MRRAATPGYYMLSPPARRRSNLPLSMSKKHTSRPLDPRAQSAIDHIRANNSYYVGPILLRNLPAALPIKGDRHSWRDAITVFLLAELIGVHRVKAGDAPFWSDVMYRVNRGDLAVCFGSDPDDISTSLQWLKAIGLVHVIHRTEIDGIGKPCGTTVYAAPRMDRIKQMLDFFATKKRKMSTSELMDSDPLERSSNSPSTMAKVTVNDASSRLDPGPYLNCVATTHKHDDEGGGETSAKRREQTVNGDRQRRVGAGGGGEAADDQSTQVAEDSFALEKSTGNDGRENQAHPDTYGTGDGVGHMAAPPRWPVPPAPPILDIRTDAEKRSWRKASLFCAVWESAITRLDIISTCKTTQGDHCAAYQYFLREPQVDHFFPLATAIDAWLLSTKPKPKDGEWDGLYHVRRSTELKSFLRSFGSGKLESEVGQHQKINAWADLRLCFTVSELVCFEWPSSRMPVKALPSEDLWENDPAAADYYRRCQLQPPPEVIEAMNTHEQSKNAAKPDPPNEL